MKQYNPKDIEKKWQARWEAENTFAVKEDSSKEKYYTLVEFPYPSGAGLHVGHSRSYTAMDIISRKRRMQGYNVLYPIGFDAFGLPTENFAIKTGRPPADVTKENIANFTRQLKDLGFSFDWDRVVDTTDPEYYKWTQWIFLQFFKHGLAYQAETTVWWCEALGTVLANEEVIDGKSERGDHPCERRPFAQWMLAITKYADSLLQGLQDVDYIPQAKIQQTNWIGKSEGAEIVFNIKDSNNTIKVFTTRPDTLFGATYMVVAPEHNIVSELNARIENIDEVNTYIEQAKSKSDLERSELQKEKTGIKLEGLVAVNPVNGSEIPVYVADYVLGSYGTGAIMAVPGHDQRDYEFAKKYDLPIIEVISSEEGIDSEAYTGEGLLMNSGFLDGLGSVDAKKKMIDWLEVKECGSGQVNYKLRDWVFSRQRYWGEPFPIVWIQSEVYNKVIELGDAPISEWLPNEPVFYTKDNTEWVAMPVPPQFLPLTLPEVDSYEPTGSGESALAREDNWVKVWYNIETGEAVSRTEVQPDGDNWVEGLRETDTMPNWAGSSWYFLRYCDPENNDVFASDNALRYWMQVDWYNGGMEHTVLHLLYSRFWNQFLYDIGVVPYKEPYAKRTSHGMILAEGGEKMSKSKGNVVNPDDIIEAYGTDILRVYISFIGPFNQAAAWDMNGLQGVKRFIERVWGFQSKVKDDHEDSQEVLKELYKTVEKVSSDIESMSFNTAIAAMMELSHVFVKADAISVQAFEQFILILSPFAPHICEELWSNFGRDKFVSLASWPELTQEQKDMTQDTVVTIAIQVNGKVRGEVHVPVDIAENQLIDMAKKVENVQKYVENKEIKKVVVVPGKLISIVV